MVKRVCEVRNEEGYRDREMSTNNGTVVSYGL